MHRIEWGSVDAGPAGKIETVVLASDEAGGVEAQFAPSAGMVGCSLRVAGEEVLGLRDGLGAYIEGHSTMGIPLLYPWANRLGELEFEVAGRTVRIDGDSAAVKLDENGLPMHGLLTASPGWEVTGRTADEVGARLRARFAFDEESGLTAAFPFPHTLGLEVELRGAELEIRAIVRADAGSTVPVAFGFHPYMRLPGLPRAEWEVSAPVANRLVLDSRGLPTGERGPAQLEPGPLGERGLDDAFTTSSGDPFVLSGGDRRIELSLLDGYPYSQLYAPPERELIAFEPMTAPTNALVSGEDLTLLEPGEEYEACYKVIPIGF